MKSIALILLILAGTFVVACQVETVRSVNDQAETTGAISAAEALVPDAADGSWRRTVDGWERVSDWQQPKTSVPSIPKTDFGAVHPGLIAMLQLLLSVGALVLFRAQSSSGKKS